MKLLTTFVTCHLSLRNMNPHVHSTFTNQCLTPSNTTLSPWCGGNYIVKCDCSLWTERHWNTFTVYSYMKRKTLFSEYTLLAGLLWFVMAGRDHLGPLSYMSISIICSIISKYFLPNITFYIPPDPQVWTTSPGSTDLLAGMDFTQTYYYWVNHTTQCYCSLFHLTSAQPELQI